MNSKVDWKEINLELPYKNTSADTKKRQKLFDKFDKNNNKTLTFTEIDKGVRTELTIDDVPDYKQAVMRAFAAAKEKNKTNSKTDENSVDFIEFRFFLLYLRQYFEYLVMFDSIEKSDNKKINFKEFKDAIPRINKWGIKIDHPEETFKKISGGDENIAFTEFSEWAIKANLDLEDDEDIADPDKLTFNADWKEIMEKIPYKKTNEDSSKRRKLFNTLDGDNNKFITLQEADNGISHFLNIDELCDCKQATAKAFEAAKNYYKSKSKFGDNCLEFIEFRYFLIYLRQYFEYFVMFFALDKTKNNKVNFKEFKSAIPILEKWNVKVDDPEETFKKISGGDAEIEFIEFCDWAIKANLDLENDMDYEEPDDNKDIDWNVLDDYIPHKKTGKDILKRKNLFKSLDANHNNYLTLTEADKFRDNLSYFHIQSLKQVIIRAFNTANNKYKSKSKKANDGNLGIDEFRFFLLYIRQYIDYFVMFAKLDDSHDKKISLDEFKSAVPQLEKWGVKVHNEEETFKKISKGDDNLDFIEFSDWAINANLDLEEVQDNFDEDEIKKIEEAKVKLEEEERIKKEEEDKIKEQEKIKKEEDDRLEQESIKKEEDDRLEQERIKKEEDDRLEQERIKKEEEERIKKEEDDKLEQERIKKEEDDRLEQERIKKEEDDRLEQERIKKEEDDRLEQERIKKEVEDRLELERIKKEEEDKLEQEKIKKEEDDRLELERIKKEEVDKLEQERIKKEEADMLEQERIKKEEDDRLEQERIKKEEDNRLEQERIKKEEDDKLDQARIKKEEDDRLEQERIKKEEDDKLEQARIKKEEDDRLEQERIKKEEADKLEQERIKKEEEDKNEQLRLQKEKEDKEKADELLRIQKEKDDREKAIEVERQRQEREDEIEAEKIKAEKLRLRQMEETYYKKKDSVKKDSVKVNDNEPIHMVKSSKNMQEVKKEQKSNKSINEVEDVRRGESKKSIKEVQEETFGNKVESEKSIKSIKEEKELTANEVFNTKESKKSIKEVLPPIVINYDEEFEKHNQKVADDNKKQNHLSFSSKQGLNEEKEFGQSYENNDTTFSSNNQLTLDKVLVTDWFKLGRPNEKKIKQTNTALFGKDYLYII